jgi:hypothetical protein
MPVDVGGHASVISQYRFQSSTGATETLKGFFVDLNGQTTGYFSLAVLSGTTVKFSDATIIDPVTNTTATAKRVLEILDESDGWVADSSSFMSIYMDLGGNTNLTFSTTYAPKIGLAVGYGRISVS